MLSKSWGKFLLLGGIGAFINSIMFIFFSDFIDERVFLFSFHIIHSSITIWAGYLFLKRKESGVFFLILSVSMFFFSIVIPVTSQGSGGQAVYTPLFFVTFIISVFANMSYPFVIIFSLLFLLSVSISFIACILNGCKTKKNAIKEDESVKNNNQDDLGNG